VVPEIPTVIQSYFESAARRDAGALDAIVATMVPDVVVVDDGRTWTGHAGVRSWKASVDSAFDYSTELTGVSETGPASYVVTGRITGNFPGGQVDLYYSFDLADDLITRLEISPRPPAGG
jgi:hypothetical protein